MQSHVTHARTNDWKHKISNTSTTNSHTDPNIPIKKLLTFSATRCSVERTFHHRVEYFPLCAFTTSNVLMLKPCTVEKCDIQHNNHYNPIHHQLKQGWAAADSVNPIIFLVDGVSCPGHDWISERVAENHFHINLVFKIHLTHRFLMDLHQSLIANCEILWNVLHERRKSIFGLFTGWWNFYFCYDEKCCFFSTWVTRLSRVGKIPNCAANASLNKCV